MSSSKIITRSISWTLTSRDPVWLQHGRITAAFCVVCAKCYLNHIFTNSCCLRGRYAPFPVVKSLLSKSATRETSIVISSYCVRGPNSCEAKWPITWQSNRTANTLNTHAHKEMHTFGEYDKNGIWMNTLYKVGVNQQSESKLHFCFANTDSGQIADSIHIISPHGF